MRLNIKLLAGLGGRDLKAVILAGGFGTRLRPLSCTRPKILFPILNKPLLQWTFERLAMNDIKDVTLAVFYQTEVYIKHHRVPRSGVHITYSHDPLRKPLGTGGSIKKAEKRIGRESPFIVLNGDIFADVNYTEILRLHEKKKGVATIALHRVQDPSRYGVAELSEDGCITRFIEKPPAGTAGAALINAGVYAFSPEIFDYIPEGRAVSIEREVFPRLAEEKALYGYVFDGFWADIGKPEDYLELNKVMLDHRSGQRMGKSGDKVQIMETVAFGKGVSIGKQSVVGPYAVLGPTVKVGKNVRIRDSVVLSGTVISDFATIDGAIIGEGVHVGKSTYIPKGCIIGDHAEIKDGVSLAAGTSICPAKEVSESVLVSNSA
jgi:mannose-1-phosphate guanylyltransferase